MPEEINTNDINSNEINEQILLNQDEKITETNQLLGATMQQNEERKQLSEAVNREKTLSASNFFLFFD